MQLTAAAQPIFTRAQRAQGETEAPKEEKKATFGSDVIDYSGPPDGRSAPRFTKVLIPLAKALTAMKYRIEIEGAENLPEKGDGGHIFAPTHPSVFDPAVVFATLGRDVRSMANQQIFRGIGG